MLGATQGVPGSLQCMRAQPRPCPPSANFPFPRPAQHPLQWPRPELWYLWCLLPILAAQGSSELSMCLCFASQLHPPLAAAPHLLHQPLLPALFSWHPLFLFAHPTRSFLPPWPSLCCRVPGNGAERRGSRRCRDFWPADPAGPGGGVLLAGVQAPDHGGECRSQPVRQATRDREHCKVGRRFCAQGSTLVLPNAALFPSQPC